MSDPLEEYPSELQDLLPKIYNLITIGNRTDDEPLYDDEFSQLLRDLDRAISLAATVEEYEATGIDNTWWNESQSLEELKEVIDQYRGDPHQRHAFYAHSSNLPSWRREGENPLLSLLLFWKAWAYHRLNPDNSMKNWSEIGKREDIKDYEQSSSEQGESKTLLLLIDNLQKMPIINDFEVIEDLYLRSVKACPANEVSAICLAHLYWMYGHFLITRSKIQEVAGVDPEDNTDVRNAEHYFDEARKALALYQVESEMTIVRFGIKPRYYPFPDYTGWIPVLEQIAIDLWGQDHSALWYFELGRDWEEFVSGGTDDEYRDLFHKSIKLTTDPVRKFWYKQNTLSLAYYRGLDESMSGLTLIEELMNDERSWEGTSAKFFTDNITRYFLANASIINETRVERVLDTIFVEEHLSGLKSSPTLFLTYSKFLVKRGAHSKAYTWLKRLTGTPYTYHGDDIAQQMFWICADLGKLDEAREALESIQKPNPDLQSAKRHYTLQALVNHQMC